MARVIPGRTTSSLEKLYSGLGQKKERNGGDWGVNKEIAQRVNAHRPFSS